MSYHRSSRAEAFPGGAEAAKQNNAPQTKPQQVRSQGGSILAAPENTEKHNQQQQSVVRASLCADNCSQIAAYQNF